MGPPMARPPTPPQGALLGLLGTAAVSYAYLGAWVVLAAANKKACQWMVSSYGFSYPVTLAMWQLAVAGAVATVAMLCGFGSCNGCDSSSGGMTQELFLRAVVPVAALGSVALWLGGSSYLYLSMPFAGMLQGVTLAGVYVVAAVLQLERFTVVGALAVAALCTGDVFVHYGEVVFVGIGLAAQIIADIAEAIAMPLLQVLLQHRGASMNPVAAVAYVAPATAAFLAIPWAALEAPTLLTPAARAPLRPDWLIMACSAALAGATMFAGAAVVQRSGAVAQQVATVPMRALVVTAGMVTYSTPPLRLNRIGWGVAACGLLSYNLAAWLGAYRTAMTAAAAANPRRASPQAKQQQQQLRGCESADAEEDLPLCEGSGSMQRLQQSGRSGRGAFGWV